MKRSSLLPMIFITIFGSSCGQKKSSSPPGPLFGEIEAAFEKAAAMEGIPKRLLMAAYFLETGFQDKEPSAYLLESGGETKLDQSFFEMHRLESGLSSGVGAYAALLKKDIGGLGLLAMPMKNDEKFPWIWEIARVHAGSQLSRVRALFARDLMKTLNTGFRYYDKSLRHFVEFAPETPAIEVENLSAALLNTKPRPSQVSWAERFNDIRPMETSEDLVPKGVEVMHCPFPFSICLRLQTEKEGTFPRAHWLIPDDKATYESPIQIASHSERIRPDSDDITIMLVGVSGTYENGSRKLANPMWLKKWQLETLGDLITDVCSAIHKNENPHIDVSDCSNPQKGVHFRHSPAEGPYRWGDIADFDPHLFNAYILMNRGLSGDSEFLPLPKNRVFMKGEAIELELELGREARYAQLERLTRCPNGRLLWENLDRNYFVNQGKTHFSESFLDAGPNANGMQYFRAKVYGKGFAGPVLMGFSLIEAEQTLPLEGEENIDAPETCFE